MDEQEVTAELVYDGGGRQAEHTIAANIGSVEA